MPVAFAKSVLPQSFSFGIANLKARPSVSRRGYLVSVCQVFLAVWILVHLRPPVERSPFGILLEKPHRLDVLMVS